MLYYIIIFGIIVVALGIYYLFKKNTEGFQDTSGNIVSPSELNEAITDSNGNLFKDTEGNHLLITQEYVDYIEQNAKEPLHPGTESLLKYATENPDTRPVTDPGRQCDDFLKQYTAMVDKSQYYRDAGDWKTYKVVLQSIANIQTQMNTMGCSNTTSGSTAVK